VCFRITVSGTTTAGLGDNQSGGWFDVEAAPGTPACGQRARYVERIVTGKGALTVQRWVHGCVPGTWAPFAVPTRYGNPVNRARFPLVHACLLA